MNIQELIPSSAVTQGALVTTAVAGTALIVKGGKVFLLKRGQGNGRQGKENIVERDAEDDLLPANIHQVDANEEAAIPFDITGFEAVGDELVVNVATYLEWPDLNSLACVSKRFRQIRNESLMGIDSTREAVIRFVPSFKDSPRGPAETKAVFQKLQRSNFIGNYSRLVVEGLKYVFPFPAESPRFVLPNITRLEIKNYDRCIGPAFQYTLRLVPNLEELVLTGGGAVPPVLERLPWHPSVRARYSGNELFPHVRILRLENAMINSSFCIDIAGMTLRSNRNIRELYLDNVTLWD
ncbi:MAG: hypothetical protein SGARI_006797, partial [Bacillariaceae sp.]